MIAIATFRISANLFAMRLKVSKAALEIGLRRA